MLLIEKWDLHPDAPLAYIFDFFAAREVSRDERLRRFGPFYTIGFVCVPCKEASPVRSYSQAVLLAGLSKIKPVIQTMAPFFRKHKHPKKCILMMWWADERAFARKDFARMMKEEAA